VTQLTVSEDDNNCRRIDFSDEESPLV